MIKVDLGWPSKESSLHVQPQEDTASSALEALVARPADAPRPGFTHLQPLLSPFQDTELQRSFHTTQQNGHAAEPPEVRLPSEHHPLPYAVAHDVQPRQLKACMVSFLEGGLSVQS